MDSIAYEVNASSKELSHLFNSFFDNYLDDYYHVYIKPLGGDLTQFQVYIYFKYQRHYYDFVRCNLLLEKQGSKSSQLKLSFFHGDAYHDYWRAALLIGFFGAVFSMMSWVNLLDIPLKWLFLIVPLIFILSFFFMRLYSKLSVETQKKRIVTAIEHQLKKNFSFQKVSAGN